MDLSTDHVESARSLRPTEPSPSPGPGPSQTFSADDLAYQLLSEVYNFRAERFQCVMKFRAELAQTWTDFYPRFLAWRERTNALLADLRGQGLTETANELASQLYRDPIVRDPGNFEIRYSTGFGDECVTIVGIDGRRSDTSQPGPQLPSQPPQATKRDAPCERRNHAVAISLGDRDARTPPPFNGAGLSTPRHRKSNTGGNNSYIRV